MQEERQAVLQQHHEELQKTHQQIQADDNVKTTFLHNVTNRMIAPSESILKSVTKLTDNWQNLTLPEVDREADNIRQQSETIIELLSHKFNAPTNQAGKEDKHE